MIIRSINRLAAMVFYIHLAFGGLFNALPFMCELDAGRSYLIGIFSVIGIIAIFVEICSEDGFEKKDKRL